MIKNREGATDSGNCLPNIESTRLASSLQDSYRELFELCHKNAEIFKGDNTEKGRRIYVALIEWQNIIKLADELVSKVDLFAKKYDFDEQTPGNGYRSFVNVTNSCIKYGQHICNNLNSLWITMYFCKAVEEIEACSQLLSSLCTCMKYLLIIHEWSGDSDNLFAFRHTAEELFEIAGTINQYCFYGHCLGFQYDNTIQRVLRLISIGMASFSEVFYSKKSDGLFYKFTRCIRASFKYSFYPDLRARRIVNISQNAEVDFCKSFWFLAESELMHKIPSIVGGSIKVNQLIEIPPESLQLTRLYKCTKIDANQHEKAEFINIAVPSSHLGPGISVPVRLLSYTRREGMMGDCGSSRKIQPRANSIVFHCHGGGFVAQSSKSHELYLRDWAQALEVPIISVDYSLAPEAPFPRALEEVFFAYSWLLKNAKYLGTTAERIILAGDSAGANLSLGVALKCIEVGIRPPDGLFLAYCPTLINFVPSPARLLCLMDPLLPFGFMMRCLHAYSSNSDGSINENTKRLENLANVKAVVSDHFVAPASKEKMAHNSTSPVMRQKSLLADQVSWNQSKCDFKYICGAKENGEVQFNEQCNESFMGVEDNSMINEQMPRSSPHNTYTKEFLNKYKNGTSTNMNAYEIDFTDQYTAGSDTNIAMSVSEEHLISETTRYIIAFDTLRRNFKNAINSISNTLNRCMQLSDIQTNKTSSPQHCIQDMKNMDTLSARSPVVELKFDVPEDPFLSPYLASTVWLSQLPHTKILTLEMDPCLDDCVMFAKKLKNLGRPVSLKILKGLPHGFLNFTMLSRESKEGSNCCISCLKDLLNSAITSNIGSKNVSDNST